MQKGVRYLIVGLLVLLLCGVVAGEEFTMQINGVDYRSLNNPAFTWGDTIRFSGTANQSTIYLFLEDPQKEMPSWNMPHACTGLTFIFESPTITPNSAGIWSYNWNTGDPVCKYPNADAHVMLYVPNKDPIRTPITMRAIVTPTPTPTPDYQAQIAALETRIAAQETTIKAQATMIQEIAVRTPVPTTIPTTVITTQTPVPTQTVDYEATLAAIQKQIDQQNDIIYQILHFLGLR